MSEMTAVAGAEILGVSARQVARLARAGELTVTRTVGGALLLDGASVHRLANQVRHNGRPWTPATAWAALALLSGERVDWLDASALSRLRHRLRAGGASQLCWMTRRRASVLRMRGWGTDTGLLASGVSALHDEAMSQLFDLTAVDGRVEGYVRARDLAGVVGAAGLIDDVGGDVIVRVVPEDAGYAVDHIVTAAVAVDLAESLDTRESAAGIGVLEDLLDRFRSGDTGRRVSGRRDR
ncbi:hypothetical protein BRW65_14100 [Mycobacterium paraffinicum]|uniref:Helix-turn-helix domain-containing protein n=4 Tax=Mycobacterium TaxID=1763 RepID=A0A1X0DV36_MYCHE|nr:hypothetical protein BMG05_06775 [Mycobacterium malmoense]OJZ73405.1 hypothetical protein BRW65_14100 [Mycobacterium paraffinicum]ORA76072.1 hypothetical protein BST25_02485 [Mycobacterium heidelbergense]ORA81125.1 hypothetical protein BST29_14695 [Mycobacterium malmoense]ORA99849.1 hypothetical protein BST30_23800 [Mycobacterium mantenii]